MSAETDRLRFANGVLAEKLTAAEKAAAEATRRMEDALDEVTIWRSAAKTLTKQRNGCLGRIHNAKHPALPVAECSACAAILRETL